MRKGFLYFRILVCASLVSVALVGNEAFAHSGKLNESGCHHVRNAAGDSTAFHCHPPQAVADYYTQQNTGEIGWYGGQVLAVIDGDTFRVKAHIWLGHSVETNVRINGIDTPELKRAACTAERKKAIASRQALIELIGKEVILHNVAYDKYGDRVRADVYNKDSVNIASLLVKAGHARFYDGKSPRSNWCK